MENLFFRFICSTFAAKLDCYQMDIHYSLFKYQFASRELEIGKRPLDSKDAVKTVFNDDFMKASRLKFTDAHSDKEYIHEYMWVEDETIVVFKLGYLRKTDNDQPCWDCYYNTDYPHCVVAMSLRNSNPFIVIANYEESFKQAEAVAQLLEDAMKDRFAGCGLSIRIRPCSDSDTEAKTWAEYMYNVYLQAKIYKADTMKALLSYENNERIAMMEAPQYKDFLLVEERYKDEVMALAHKYIDPHDKANKVMRVILVFKDLAIANDPPYIVFANEFGKGKGRSASSYSEYLGKKAYIIRQDPSYNQIKDMFRKYSPLEIKR